MLGGFGYNRGTARRLDAQEAIIREETMNSIVIAMRRLGAAALASAATLTALPAAHAAELHILSAGAAKSVVAEAVLAFEKKTGAKITAEYMPVGPIIKRLAEGAESDLVVLSQETMAQASEKGWILPPSLMQVGRVGLAVAVKEGAPAPDISTVDAFKKTLLAAKSIVYVDPARASSGKHFASVLEKLGIAAEMKPKTKIVAGGYVAELVAKGEAELAVHLVTELLPVKGITIVGPFPAEVQKFIVYQAAVGAKAPNKEYAHAFLALLVEPEFRALALKKGFMN